MRRLRWPLPGDPARTRRRSGKRVWRLAAGKRLGPSWRRRKRTESRSERPGDSDCVEGFERGPCGPDLRLKMPRCADHMGAGGLLDCVTPNRQPRNRNRGYRRNGRMQGPSRPLSTPRPTAPPALSAHGAPAEESRCAEPAYHWTVRRRRMTFKSSTADNFVFEPSIGMGSPPGILGMTRAAARRIR